MKRAYSLIEIKSVDEEQRTIEGIASTPATDLYDDIVEPMGAEFKLPLPFLWQHDKSKPIGHVTAAKATKDNISVKIKLAKTDEPGPLKDLLDLAWQSIKLGLVRGLSIGFRDIESADISGTWGKRFTKWLWLELSAVTIPANIEATMQTVKSYDERSRGAALGSRPVRYLKPGASGLPSQKPKASEKEMTIKEQIAALEATRAAKAARLEEVQNKASEEGRTKDESEKEEFDTLRDELKSIDTELVDLRDLEALNATKAAPVTTKPETKAASESRSGRVEIVHEEKLDPGIEFARFAMCTFAAGPNNTAGALNLMKTHYPRQVRAINVLKAAVDGGTTVAKLISKEMKLDQKAAVAGATTAGTYWASPLVEYNVFAGDFIEYLRPRTVIGQFGMNGVPDFNRIPFNVHIKGQTSGGTGYWVGEGKPKPLTSFNFSDAEHKWYKVAAIAVLTDEIIRFSNPSAERLVRDALAGCIIERFDTDFVDPTKAISAGVSPASLTNGLVAITTSGTDADAVRADIKALLAPGIAANQPINNAVFITTPSIALSLALMQNALGQAEFPDMTMNGGRLLGFPVITSNYVTAGDFLVVYANEVYMSDDGVVTVDASREASLQMLDNPTNASSDGTATTMVSMFQTDSVALRAERYINWSKRRATACAYIDSVAWGDAAS